MIYFMISWYILWYHDIFYDIMIYFIILWYILWYYDIYFVILWYIYYDIMIYWYIFYFMTIHLNWGAINSYWWISNFSSVELESILYLANILSASCIQRDMKALSNRSTIYMAPLPEGSLAVQAGLRTRHITTVDITTACRTLPIPACMP